MTRTTALTTTLTAAAALLYASSAMAAIVPPSTTTFGNAPNDGYGGFTAEVAAGNATPAPAWTLQTSGARMTNNPTGPGSPPDSGQVNSSLLNEVTLTRTAGSAYTITGVIDWISTYAADNNRAGIMLFATSGGLAAVDSGLSLQVNVGDGAMSIREGGVNGNTNFTAAALSGVTGADLIGKTLNFSAAIDFVGSNIDVSFTLSAPSLSYSQTIGRTVAAASFTGEFFGFGTRGRVRNGNAGFIYEAKSFSVAAVPEPASLALLGLGGLVILGRRRRA